MTSQSSVRESLWVLVVLGVLGASPGMVRAQTTTTTTTGAGTINLGKITFKKGDAEARAMNVKAEAYQEWNQAAVVDKIITNMPEIVRALASPLANVDKITIVSTGCRPAANIMSCTSPPKASTSRSAAR